VARLTSTSKVSATTATIDWSFIDDIYLITTNAQGDRLARTMEELASVGINRERVKVRVFKPDDEDRVRGCYTSHIAIMEEIKNTAAKNRKKSTKSGGTLVLEDNLEATVRFNSNPAAVVNSVEQYLEKSCKPGDWDVFHLGYMMYVPGLQVKRLTSESKTGSVENNIVQLFSSPGTSVGTSAYLISKSGVDAVLAFHRKNGYQNDAIPNIMALLFPESRFAPFPMVFHRAATVGSLVNPQLDDFRKIMFSPAIYTTWESLMVSTGWSTNKLFPSVLVTFVVTFIAVIASAFSSDGPEFNLGPILVTIPIAVALWGASLFSSSKGYAATQKL